jgi:hypothetical protein
VEPNALELDAVELDTEELDSWSLILGRQMPWIFMLGQRPCAEIFLFGHFFLDL